MEDIFSMNPIKGSAPSVLSGRGHEFRPVPEFRPALPPAPKEPVFTPGAYTISKHDKENLFPLEPRNRSSKSPSPSNTNHTSTPTQMLCCIGHRGSGSVELLDLPVEVLEQIAMCCLDSGHQGSLDFAATFVLTNSTNFSSGRFGLSALTQVNKHVRGVVERVLYRDLQLDFTAWKGRKHSRHPSGCLKRLLRTLEERADLCRYILSVALCYPSSGSTEIDESLAKFINLTPNLRTISIPQCPPSLWSLSCHGFDRIETFAALYVIGILEAALGALPSLKHLQLRDGPTAFQGLGRDNISHQLESFRLDSCNGDVTFNLFHSLRLCSGTATSLDLRFTGSLVYPSPSFVSCSSHKIMPAWGSNLRSLRMDNLSILSEANISTTFAETLRALPKLRHLHLSHHNPISPKAFSILAPSVNLLTLSDYFGVWESNADKDEELFMEKVSEAMEEGRTIHQKVVKKMVAWPGDGSRLAFMKPVIDFGIRQKVPLDIINSSQAFIELHFDTL